MWLILFNILTIASAISVSEELCNRVNERRAFYNVNGTLQHSNAMRRVSEIHIDNLLDNNYNPFVSSGCNPHRWFEDAELGIEDCCNNCMGLKGRELFDYSGITNEIFYAIRRNWFFVPITSSDISVDQAVWWWEQSERHNETMMGDFKLCGGAMIDYQSAERTFMGMAAMWFGTTDDDVVVTLRPTQQPSRQPTETPTLHPLSPPSLSPSLSPSLTPSQQPSLYPTQQPSQQPSLYPTQQPSRSPILTQQPSLSPTNEASRTSTSTTTQPQTSTKDWWSTLISLSGATVGFLLLLMMILLVVVVYVLCTRTKQSHIQSLTPLQQRQLYLSLLKHDFNDPNEVELKEVREREVIEIL